MSDLFSSLVRSDGNAAGEAATERLPRVAPVAGGADAAADSGTSTRTTGPPSGSVRDASGVDLTRRRDELRARFAELQWDLGGLTYEMAIRDHIRLEVLVREAATLQDVDAELGEVERILQLQETGNAGSCVSCGAPHSAGAVYCWQCGQALLRHVPSDAIGA